jgi:hypothetical protein
MKSWRSTEIYRPIPRNVVFYDGPSRLNGDRILAIATAQNGNRKIGRMLQLWILPAISPIQAVKTGADAAVCGDCRLRGDGHGNRRVCYVEYFRAVENIWQSQHRADRTDRLDVATFAQRVAGLQLRIGAYGDPVAVPLTVWRPLLAVAGGWTAYSHQWRRGDLTDGYRDWCMASVDSAGEQLEASARGWRTFRVRRPGSVLDAREVVCPHEQDDTVHCADCSLCRGASRQAKNIVVTVHGNGQKHFQRAPVDVRPRLIPIQSLRG